METITDGKPKRRGKKPPDAPTDYRVVPLTAVRENPRNPRKTFDGIDELAASIAAMGQIVPGLARPHPTETDAFELVAGHRRLRACERAGVATFRVVLKDMDDATALKVMLVENGQRADVPPLEEAESYRQLRDDHGFGVAQIAADVGRSEAHVYQRLKLTELIPGVQDLLRAGNVQLRSALLFARLDAKGQAAALKALRARQEHEVAAGNVLSHREVDHHVLLHSRNVAHARWALGDKDLVPSAGACLDCGKRTHAQAQLFHIGDTGTHDACLDVACWESKVAAHAQRELDAACDSGLELVDPKEAKALWAFGGGLVDGWIDAERHVEHDVRRRYGATDAERERALVELSPELAAHRVALAGWTRRAGAYLEQHQTPTLPPDFEHEPDEPEKAPTWLDVLGTDHPNIKVTLDRDGHARRIIPQHDLAAALWALGMKDAYKVMAPPDEAPLPGSPAQTRADNERAAWKRERDHREQRAREAAAVREAAMVAAASLPLEELILAVTLMVCRYGAHPHEADQLRRALRLKATKRDRDLYLDPPNAALWAHAKDALAGKPTSSKDRLLLALRILAERPVLEASHDAVLRAILDVDVKAARNVARDRRKQIGPNATSSAPNEPRAT